MGSRKIVRLCVLALGVFGGYRSYADNKPIDHANVFIAAYGQSCTGFGQYTQNALQMNQSLIDILLTLRDDPACSAVYNALDSVRLMGDHLQYLYADPSKLALRERQNAFLGEVVKGLDVDKIVQGVTAQDFLASFPFTNIVQTFGTAHVASRATDLAQGREELDRRRQIDQVAANYFHQMGQAIHASATCMVGHPNVPAAIIGQTLAVVGSYVPHHYGAAMVLIGSLINELNEFFRKLPFDKAVKESVQAKFYNAMSCGAEAIVNTYCEASETRDFLQIQIDALSKGSQNPSEIWAGLEILSRDYPKLKQWLAKVKDGVQAINREQAIRIIQVEQKDAKQKQTGHYLSGEYGYAVERTQSAGTPEERRSIVQQFVNRISAFAFDGNSNAANPYVEFFPTEGECQFKRSAYLGLNSIPPIPVGSTCEDELLNDALNAFDLQKVKTNVDDVQSRVRAVVSNEKRQVIGSGADPQSVWIESTQEDTLGRQNLRTLRKVDKLLGTYVARWKQIVQNPPASRDVAYLKLQIEYAEKIRKDIVQPVIALIEAPSDLGPDGKPMTFMQKLTLVNQIFKLGPETDFLLLRLIGFIDVDLNERLHSGEVEDHLAELIRLAAQDFYKQFTKSQSVDAIYQDLANALSISQDTIDIYMEFMGPYLVKGVKHFKKLSTEANEKVDHSKPDPLSHMMYFNASKVCTLALSSSDRTVNKIYEDRFLGALSTSLKSACQKMVYYSPLYKVAPLKIEFDVLRQQPWEKRVCALHSMNQKARVFELNALIQNSYRDFGPHMKFSPTTLRYY